MFEAFNSPWFYYRYLVFKLFFRFKRFNERSVLTEQEQTWIFRKCVEVYFDNLKLFNKKDKETKNIYNYI